MKIKKDYTRALVWIGICSITILIWTGIISLFYNC